MVLSVRQMLQYEAVKIIENLIVDVAIMSHFRTQKRENRPIPTLLPTQESKDHIQYETRINMISISNNT